MFGSMAKVIKETHTLYIMILCFLAFPCPQKRYYYDIALLCTLSTVVSSFLNSRVRVPMTSLLA